MRVSVEPRTDRNQSPRLTREVVLPREALCDSCLDMDKQRQERLRMSVITAIVAALLAAIAGYIMELV